MLVVVVTAVVVVVVPVPVPVPAPPASTTAATLTVVIVVVVVVVVVVLVVAVLVALAAPVTPTSLLVAALAITLRVIATLIVLACLVRAIVVALLILLVVLRACAVTACAPGRGAGAAAGILVVARLGGPRLPSLISLLNPALTLGVGRLLGSLLGRSLTRHLPGGDGLDEFPLAEPRDPLESLLGGELSQFRKLHFGKVCRGAGIGHVCPFVAKPTLNCAQQCGGCIRR